MRADQIQKPTRTVFGVAAELMHDAHVYRIRGHAKHHHRYYLIKVITNRFIDVNEEFVQ